MSEHDEVRRRLELLSDEELSAIVQERDEEQWRPEVFDIAASILGSRGVSSREVLAAELAETAQDWERGEFADPRKLTAVARYTDPLLAHTDRLALEQAGLRAWVTEYGSATHENDSGAILQVRPEDLNAALEFLDSASSSASDLSHEFAGGHCPRCGSTEVTELDEVVNVVEASSVTITSSEQEVYFYRCRSCNHNWSALV